MNKKCRISRDDTFKMGNLCIVLQDLKANSILVFNVLCSHLFSREYLRTI